MIKATVTVGLDLNSRTTAGCQTAEDNGFLGIVAFYGKEIHVTLDELDFGRYDSEGVSYLAEVLDVLPGDIRYENLNEVL